MVTAINLQHILFEDFGKYVFDGPRSDIPMWDKEQMSPEETNALDILQQFFRARSPEAKQALAGVMPELLQMKTRYPNELDPTSVPYLYRATSWGTREEALRMLKTPQEVGEMDQMKVQEGPLKLRPKPSDSGISIWTTAENLETTLVDTVGLKAGFVTVFRASTQNNPFLGAPGKLVVALGISDLQSEMEVLAFGPVNCDAVSFSFDDTHMLPNFKTAFLQLSS
jgi:hypothetical protein